MAPPTFFFFHVGDQTSQPEMLVASIRRSNPRARVVHLSDATTPIVRGVDGRIDFAGDRTQIMRFRYDCYAGAVIRDEISIFLDTDMLVLKPIDVDALLDAQTDAVLCSRFFNREALVNVNFRQMNMTELSGKTLGEAWPFMGCFIASRSPAFMRALCEAYDQLPGKYKVWYGDQTVLREVAGSGQFRIRTVDESRYACLVDARNPDPKLIDEASILHFKGAAKALMKPFSDRLAGVDRRSAGLPPVKRSEGAEPGAFPRIAGLPAGDYCVITPYLLPPGSPKAVNIGDGFILDSAIRLIGRKPCALYSSRAPLNASDITRINESSALLIAGANTLKDRFEITPGFDLHLLDRIKVPVMLMGLGHYGDPKATAHGLTRESSGLLRAILERFPLMSVRCDASQTYVMAALPEMAERVLMTSCPVAYAVDQVNRRFDASRALTNVIVTITDRTRIDEQLWMLAFAKARFPALHHTLALHQDHGNQPLWRHADKLGYRVFRSARYEDFIDLYATADLHFGNRVHGHLKCLAMGICSYLAPFDLRHRFFAESLDFPLIAQGGTDEFRTYRFDRFLQARQAAAGSMVRFIAAVRSTLK